MPRFFVKSKQIDQTSIHIIGEDVKHIKNVLRKQVGDILEICNQDTGNVYECKIEDLKEQEIITNIIEKSKNIDNRIKVDIYQGLPKSDKMELIIQKSVELGVNEIIPVVMKRCVVKIDSKSENKKIERWQKIAESAAKQSSRNGIPLIHNIINLKDIIDVKDKYDLVIVCYENEKDNYIKNELLKLKELDKKEINIAIVIGPEGGLEEQEVQQLQQNGAKIISLGDRILRTETVALNTLSVIMYEFEN